jgi:hypothetical protein
MLGCLDCALAWGYVVDDVQVIAPAHVGADSSRRDHIAVVNVIVARSSVVSVVVP